jgi:hypothetical protein
MKIKKLRQKIYDDIQEVLAQELRILAKDCDKNLISERTYWNTSAYRIEEYKEWEKDLMLTCDAQLNEKFKWIMETAKKSRKNPAYHSTYPDSPIKSND